MLIHPWDAALDSAEWQDWLASAGRFGILAVNNLDPAWAPLMLPTHFTDTGDELLIHLARPNPVWPRLEAAAEVRPAVTGDYAYIPTFWRARAGCPPGQDPWLRLSMEALISMASGTCAAKTFPPGPSYGGSGHDPSHPAT